jgi:hypothetical protein
MIHPRGLSAAAATALVLSMAAPAAGLAEYKANNGGNVRAGGGYRPAVSPARPAPAVVGAPAVGASRAATPMPQPATVFRGAEGIGDHGSFRGDHDHDHDRDRDRRAFVPGGVVIIGGAAVVGPPAYFAPGYSGDQYSIGGPAVAPAAASDDAIAACMQAYPSYDPQSGTYIGDDGLQHPCP